MTGIARGNQCKGDNVMLGAAIDSSKQPLTK
ncbi:hypothetical protein F442_11404 [Phytophthora nicotianae P10297]|uniref:Uncharacterized protein n=5 Tax=Phytophthora nicotianae TaxID=4792 RepID=W2Z277_PHYNI|nr:hypothetical protein PPTG_23240 [Phytophthora nicotianae INRA-310]ETI43596.1 hypothetical protein F443_11508 [Phytophthora nicotianae P1569]ETL90220.1 hypothetical protein L917_11004 [Phytophthora nicotianae]ETO72270.1 hypothetical protein F444_11580 [Phytophthora nicotianae P1976]ETP41438.1 hypothetical protein F442_11405 [Phytophthora nicotianae P10297]ETL90252.1 hypothetical protein L917_11002 [Phytophthora nicotianae]